MVWGFEMNEVGKRVATLRKAMRISQRELSARCEISQPTVANIERGRTHEVKGYVLEALARELNTSTGFILYGAETEDDHEDTMMITEITHIFRKLTRQEKDTVITVVRAMAQQKQLKKEEIAVNKIAMLTV